MGLRRFDLERAQTSARWAQELLDLAEPEGTTATQRHLPETQVSKGGHFTYISRTLSILDVLYLLPILAVFYLLPILAVLFLYSPYFIYISRTLPISAVFYLLPILAVFYLLPILAVLYLY
jgi:hypothetical protein